MAAPADDVWLELMCVSGGHCVLCHGLFSSSVMGRFEDGGCLLAWVSEWLCWTELLFWSIKDMSTTEKLFCCLILLRLGDYSVSPSWLESRSLVRCYEIFLVNLCSSVVLWVPGTPSSASLRGQDSLKPCPPHQWCSMQWWCLLRFCGQNKRRKVGLCKVK